MIPRLTSRKLKEPLESNKKELSRQRIRLKNGSSCDLVKYDIAGYGVADFIENTTIGNGQFRRARSLMPFNYLDASLDKFNWRVYETNVTYQQKIVQSFVDKFRDYQKAGKGLYIFSRTKGSGKTFLACCMANEILNYIDTCVKFISIPELLDMTKKSYTDYMLKSDIETIKTAELLILDDIGAETRKEWVDSELFKIIDYRYSNNKVTIFTSNVPMGDLKLNERIVDRICSMSVNINIPEKSVRMIQANRNNMNFLKDVMS